MSNNLPLPMNRELHFTKQVDQASIADLTKAILDINENDRHLEKLYPVYGLAYTPKPIRIYIDSYGGHVYQCFGLLSVMDKSETPIHTIVTGTAMSCGFLMSIHGHERFCYPNSTLMYHQVSSGVRGKAKDIEEEVIEVKRLQSMIEEMTLRKTKISLDRIKEVYATKLDWFISSEDALKLGCVDKIL